MTTWELEEARQLVDTSILQNLGKEFNILGYESCSVHKHILRKVEEENKYEIIIVISTNRPEIYLEISHFDFEFELSNS